MKNIITTSRFARFTEPEAILPVIDIHHRAASMLRALCARHPRVFTERELMWIGGFKAEDLGPICAATAFHFWILRINDSLPRTGWRVCDQSGYRLTPITADHAAMLEHRLNRRAA